MCTQLFMQAFNDIYITTMHILMNGLHALLFQEHAHIDYMNKEKI